jgi:hypothetical protein
MYSPVRIALSVLFVSGLAAHGQPGLPGTPRPGARAATAEMVVIGKIVDVETETVEAPPYAGAPRDVKASFKVAVLKADEIVIGGRGLTQFRIGFPADAPPASVTGDGTAGGLPVLPPAPAGGRLVAARTTRLAVALTVGMDGCFFLSKYSGTDFYVADGAPLARTDAAYAKAMDEVRKVANAIEEPAAALKAKDLGDRYLAARAILQRYQTSRPGRTERKPIPDEENRLILDLLAELPWVAADGMPDSPSRSGLWLMIRPAELGFRQPKATGADYNALMDKATAEFVKGNRDKIRIRRFAE